MPSISPFTSGSWPVPVGAGYSFRNVAPAVNTKKFDLPAGDYILTFQPIDVNNPGTLILYDNSNVAQVTMLAAGYATFKPITGGLTGYYFTASAGANMAAIIAPYRGT